MSGSYPLVISELNGAGGAALAETKLNGFPGGGAPP